MDKNKLLLFVSLALVLVGVFCIIWGTIWGRTTQTQDGVAPRAEYTYFPEDLLIQDNVLTWKGVKLPHVMLGDVQGHGQNITKSALYNYSENGPHIMLHEAPAALKGSCLILSVWSSHAKAPYLKLLTTDGYYSVSPAEFRYVGPDTAEVVDLADLKWEIETWYYVMIQFGDKVTIRTQTGIVEGDYTSRTIQSHVIFPRITEDDVEGFINMNIAYSGVISYHTTHRTAETFLAEIGTNFYGELLGPVSELELPPLMLSEQIYTIPVTLKGTEDNIQVRVLQDNVSAEYSAISASQGELSITPSLLGRASITLETYYNDSVLGGQRRTVANFQSTVVDKPRSVMTDVTCETYQWVHIPLLKQNYTNDKDDSGNYSFTVDTEQSNIIMSTQTGTIQGYFTKAGTYTYTITTNKAKTAKLEVKVEDIDVQFTVQSKAREAPTKSTTLTYISGLVDITQSATFVPDFDRLDREWSFSVSPNLPEGSILQLTHGKVEIKATAMSPTVYTLQAVSGDIMARGYLYLMSAGEFKWQQSLNWRIGQSISVEPSVTLQDAVSTPLPTGITLTNGVLMGAPTQEVRNFAFTVTGWYEGQMYEHRDSITIESTDSEIDWAWTGSGIAATALGLLGCGVYLKI
jgi:hypothetical protein